MVSNYLNHCIPPKELLDKLLHCILFEMGNLTESSIYIVIFRLPEFSLLSRADFLYPLIQRKEL